MKRFLMILIGVFLLCPALSYAVGTVTGPVVTKATVGQTQRITLAYTFTADAGAAMASATLNPETYKIAGWYLYEVEVDPGSTGPTNGAWDFDITDARSYVVSEARIDDKSSTATSIYRFASSSTGYPMIRGTWTLSIGDNAVNNASVTVYLTFVSN